MLRIATGDHEAFAILTERHLPRTVGLATRLMGSAADAEEVAQDAFIRIWTHATRWQPGAARFTTWLYRVTLNLCIDRKRKKPMAALDDAPEPQDESAGGFEAVRDAQLAKHVQAALDTLPEAQRQAMILCNHEGLSNAEAADILDISVKAVESLLVRARRTLRTRLQALYTEVTTA